MSDSREDKIAQLRAKQDELRAEAKALAEGRKLDDFTAEEVSRLEEIHETIDYLDGQIQSCMRLQGILEPEQRAEGSTRRTTPSGPPRTMLDKKAGFDHFGEFVQSVAHSARPGAQMAPKLAQMAPTTYSTEGAGADGGFAVPPEFSANIMEYVSDQNSLYSLVEKRPVNQNLSMPMDEDAPWSTSGPQAYWEGEAEQYTESKVNLKTFSMRLNKCVVLCPVSDELLDDAPQMGSYLASVIGKKMRWKIDDAILSGTGAGMPLGILNAPCLKTVAKEGSQTATTVTDGNIFAMWNACFGDNRGSAVWIANQDIEVQLLSMVLAGASSDVPVWLPAGSTYANVANAPNGTLFGRPLVYHQACETLGAEGDIYFADMSQYLLGQKTSGPAFATSIHLYFDYGMSCVRATWRLAGAPKWSTTISAANGSATYSPFVSLAVRA